MVPRADPRKCRIRGQWPSDFLSWFKFPTKWLSTQRNPLYSTNHASWKCRICYRTLICYRDPPCADTIFLGFYKHCPSQIGDKKSTQTFTGQRFAMTLRVMDVRAKNRGRLHQKMGFPAAPVMGRNFLIPAHPGVRVRNIQLEIRTKNCCLCCFSSLIKKGSRRSTSAKALRRSNLLSFPSP